MKKQQEIENGTQLNLDEAIGIKPIKPAEEEETKQTEHPHQQRSRFTNDEGKEISVENGYSPADVEELERLAREGDEDENEQTI